MRSAKARAWTVIGAAVGATVVGLLLVISAAPTSASLNVTFTSRGLLSIVADGPLGVVALNERLSAMNLPVRMLRASRACEASARIAGPGGRRGPRRAFGVTSMIPAPTPRAARRAWLDARVALPKRFGETVVVTVVDGGRRLLEQTIVGTVPACVRVFPVPPTASALTS